MKPALRRSLALASGIACHGTFVLALAWMASALYGGMQVGRGPWHGTAAWIANGLLVLQFPLLHSLLLTSRGRRALAKLAPGGAGAVLAPTTYATSAAAQLLLTFACWSPSGIVWSRPAGALAVLWSCVFAASWLFLARALYDGGLGLQTGWIGWTALWRASTLCYGPMPVEGVFRLCRQPIYLGFAATLWTGPVWTPDHLLIAVVWTLYCVLGPLHKESRFRRIHGAAFEAYRSSVPYIVPRVFS